MSLTNHANIEEHIMKGIREHAASPHLCSASGSLGPAANVAYNMSRLHPSSQRSKTMQNYSKTLFVAKLQTQFFASEICYYVSQSVVQDHRITIYSCSHPYIDLGLLTHAESKLC